jgi:hypothetical protein
VTPVEAIAILTDRGNAQPPRVAWARPEADSAGLYSWWADALGLDQLSAITGVALPPLIYVGQTGATKWPSGRRSTATLRTRLRTHATASISSSTFRLTLAAFLADELSLVRAKPGRLDRESNQRLTAWIERHLTVAIVPIDEADGLGNLEALVVRSIDAPLNLDHCESSSARELLKQRRRALVR